MIETFFSEARHHETNKEYKVEARKFIHDEFKRHGLETEYQIFYDNRYPKVCQLLKKNKKPSISAVSNFRGLMKTTYWRI